MIDKLLIATRLDELPRLHPQQIEVPCSRCLQPVVLFPASQKALQRSPRTQVVCTRCCPPLAQARSVRPAGTMADVLREIRESKPRH